MGQTLRALGCVATFVSMLLCTSLVHAESRHTSHHIGIGTAMGMDAPSTGRLTGSLLESGSGIYLQLPTFEIRRYLATGHSIDFQLPIGDLLLAALVHPASGLPALPLGLGIHYTLFFPQKNFRWFVGPGAWLNAGIQFAGPVSVALGFQPGVQLGVEWQTGDVGVMLRVRPYATLGAAIAHGGISELLGVGASVEFAILHYR